MRAQSGEEALRHLLHDDFAVVLLDVQMGDLDGFETAKLIRARDKSRHTPIIFLTAYESNRLPVEAAYSLGAVDYLVKPVVPIILRAKVMGFVELFEKAVQLKLQSERLRQLERRDFERQLAAENARLQESSSPRLNDLPARQCYLSRLCQRKYERRFDPTDSLFPIVHRAFDAMHQLRITPHDMTYDATGRPRTD